MITKFNLNEQEISNLPNYVNNDYNDNEDWGIKILEKKCTNCDLIYKLPIFNSYGFMIPLSLKRFGFKINIIELFKLCPICCSLTYQTEKYKSSYNYFNWKIKDKMHYSYFVIRCCCYCGDSTKMGFFCERFSLCLSCIQIIDNEFKKNINLMKNVHKILFKKIKLKKMKKPLLNLIYNYYVPKAYNGIQ